MNNQLPYYNFLFSIYKKYSLGKSVKILSFAHFPSVKAVYALTFRNFLTAYNTHTCDIAVFYTVKTECNLASQGYIGCIYP